MNVVYGYTKCSTVKKALKFLDENNIEYKHIDNVSDKLTEKQIKDIYNQYMEDNKGKKKSLRNLFNTSGMKYRELGLASKLDDMSDEEKFELLSTDGMLVKRPILVNDDNVLIGFKQKEWEEEFGILN